MRLSLSMDTRKVVFEDSEPSASLDYLMDDVILPAVKAMGYHEDSIDDWVRDYASSLDD